MRKLLLLGAVAALCAPASMQGASLQGSACGQRAPFAYKQRQPEPKGVFAPFQLQSAAAVAQHRVAPALSTTGGHQFGYLEMPDGQTWFYDCVLDTEAVVHNEYWTEHVIRGYTFTIYDAQFNVKGTIHDTIKLADDENGVAAVMMDGTVTKKFFNYNDAYEFIVSIAANKPDYTMHQYSKIYSLGSAPGDDGCTPVDTVMEGYVCDSANGAADAWSENFYISFVNDYAPASMDSYTDLGQYAGDCGQEVTTYKKCGYSSGPQLINTLRVANPCLPGDQMSVPFFFSIVKGSKVYFVSQQYEHWFFSNAVGPQADEDGNVTGMPDEFNNLVVDIKSYNGWGDALTDVKEVKIPANQTDNDANTYFSYYSVGNLDWSRDIRLGDDGQPTGFNLARQKYLVNNDDSYLTDYFRTDAEGVVTKTIGTDINSVASMTDLPGFQPQALFVKIHEGEADEDGNMAPSTADFSMIDLDDAEEVVSFPSVITTTTSLKANVDRYPVGGKYQYCFETNNIHTDQAGNIYEHIAWVDTQGEVVRTDTVSLGQNIAMAMPYIRNQALNPYVFNTNDAREYMYLVKRYTDPGNESSTQEEFLILDNEGRTLFRQEPDAERGAILSVSLLNADTEPDLAVVFRNTDTSEYTYAQDFYTLPLVSFEAGGSGTAEDPYMIASVGDLQQIKADTKAHYALAGDIENQGHLFRTIASPFTGSLDGRGHTVTGLQTATGAMFADTGSADFEGENPVLVSDSTSIRNITFVGAKLGVKGLTGSLAGLLAATAANTVIDGVNIYGLQASDPDADAIVGSLVGVACLQSKIKNCEVASATLDLPKSTNVGGLAGKLATLGRVDGCAFRGTINAAGTVGGITGSGSDDAFIKDCHVDARITAANTIGGIIGYSDRTRVSRCYVEGQLRATAPFSQYLDRGPCMGGIAGELEPFWGVPYTYDYFKADEKQLDNMSPIHHCFVNLSLMERYESTEPEGFAGQHDTMHRIAGRVADYNSEDEETAPDFFEKTIGDNYASEYCEPGNAQTEASTYSVEGQTVKDDDLNQAWFKENLGLKYGADGLWKEASDWDPCLAIERTNFLTSQEYTAYVGEPVYVSVVFAEPYALSEEDALGFLTADYDETMLEMTGAHSFADNTLSVEFMPLKAGRAYVTLCGAKGVVNIAQSGIEQITEAQTAPRLRVAGRTATAAGCQLTVTALDGRTLCSGRDAIDMSALSSGIYIVSATGADGRREALKVNLR